jgi:hypothetical protein
VTRWNTYYPQHPCDLSTREICSCSTRWNHPVLRHVGWRRGFQVHQDPSLASSQSSSHLYKVRNSGLEAVERQDQHIPYNKMKWIEIGKRKPRKTLHVNLLFLPLRAAFFRPIDSSLSCNCCSCPSISSFA